MTPEEFEGLLRLLDGESTYGPAHGMRLAEAVVGLDEKQRKKLSKTAKAFWEQTWRSPIHGGNLDFAQLAVLAVGSAGDVRKIGCHFGNHDDAATKVLIDRKVDWINDWLGKLLDDPWPRVSWKILRALVCAGVCRKSESPGYAQVMSWGIKQDGDSQVRISERLMNEPELIEDIWRFFEQDICPFHEGSEWIEVLRELSGQGLIDRQRLLDSALGTLFHDVKDDIRSGFIRCYRSLEPTPAERAARQKIFLELLSHRASPAVAFALDELVQLDKQKALAGEALLASGKSVFALKPKGQPLTALKLAASVAKRQPELVPAAISFVLEGLGHDSPDVQKHALAMLEGWQNRLHHDHFVEIRERSSSLSATARKQAEALLASAGSQIGSPAASKGLPATDRASLESRVAGLEGKWRKLAGVDRTLEAIDRKELPSALEFSLLDVPVLTGTGPVVPIQSVDELLDATAHAIEVMESGDEIERIVDGISRLCDQRPVDFELRAAPLVARMESEPEQDALRGLRNPYLLPEFVAQLILSWLSGRPRAIADANKPRHTFKHLANIHAFINMRAKEIEKRVLARQPAPMLSAPTHKFGWLEPCEFVRRLKSVATTDEFPTADLIQALLRLAPDNRTRALDDARELAGEIGWAVRWALGGDDGPATKDRTQFAVWLAAGRARNPHGELKELAPLLPGDDAVFVLSPPTYEWVPSQQANDPYCYRSGGEVPLEMRLNSPDIHSPELQVWPAVALCQLIKGWVWGFRASWDTQWLTSFWPLNCESRLAAGAKVLCQRVNAPASSLEPNYVYLLPLLEPDRPWSELAYLVCWIALVSKDASSRGMGVDCLIQAIDDGRAASEQAADVFIRLLSGGWVKLNRVAETLQEIARVSPYHAWWSAALVQECIVGVAEFPSDAHHLLTFLVEQLTELELPLAPRTKERLVSTKFSGKSAKLVGQLLKLEFKGPSAKVVTAVVRALDARLARAERWSQTCPK